MSEMHELPIKAGNHLRASSGLIGWTGIKEDLNVVNDTCLQALELVADDVSNAEALDERGRTWFQAFYLTAVITYARCFNSGERTRLEESHVRRAAGDQADEAVAVHRILMATRDKHFAHSVSRYEEGICGIITRPDGSVWGIDTHLYTQTVAPHGFLQMRMLVAGLLPIVNERILRARSRVLEEASAMSTEDLMGLPEIEWSPPGIADLMVPRSAERTPAPDGTWIYSRRVTVNGEQLAVGQIPRSGPDGPMRRRSSVSIVNTDRDAVWGDLGLPEG